jgi:hypothetical protein
MLKMIIYITGREFMYGQKFDNIAAEQQGK